MNIYCFSTLSFAKLQFKSVINKAFHKHGVASFTDAWIETGTPETEEQVKNETKATIRCIPLEGDKTPGKCMVTGRPSAQRVLFARAY